MAKTNQFKLARIMAGLKQQQLSELSGVSATTISKIENGTYGDLKPLRKVAKALKKKVVVILE